MSRESTISESDYCREENNQLICCRETFICDLFISQKHFMLQCCFASKQAEQPIMTDITNWRKGLKVFVNTF